MNLMASFRVCTRERDEQAFIVLLNELQISSVVLASKLKRNESRE